MTFKQFQPQRDKTIELWCFIIGSWIKMHLFLLGLQAIYRTQKASTLLYANSGVYIPEVPPLALPSTSPYSQNPSSVHKSSVALLRAFKSGIVLHQWLTLCYKLKQVNYMFPKLLPLCSFDFMNCKMTMVSNTTVRACILVNAVLYLKWDIITI